MPPAMTGLDEPKTFPVAILAMLPIILAISGAASIALSNALDDAAAGAVAADVAALGQRGWLFIGAVSAWFVGYVLSMLLASARRAAGVPLPSQHVLASVDAPKSAVLVVDDGAVGRFNRAQNAYVNYTAMVPGFLTIYLMVGWFLPRSSTLLVAVAGVARIVSAIGYRRSVNGRMLGFFVWTLTMYALTHLAISIAAVALQWSWFPAVALPAALRAQ